MTAYTSPDGDREGKPGEIPADMADQVEQYRTQLLDSVVETDEALMERYLDGQELTPEEVASALKSAVTRGELFPVMCGVATKNLGTTAVLDLLVEGVPSPAKKGSPIEVEGASSAAFIFKTVADPFSGRINVFRVLKGTISSDATLANVRTHGKERVGALLTLQGKEHESADEFGEGDLGAVAKLKDVMTGDLLLDSDQQVELPSLDFPEPVMSFAITPKAKGDEEKVAHLAPPTERGGPDAPATPRPADRRAARLGHDADARRGRGRPAEAPLRRRGRPQPAARARTWRRSARSRAGTAATRSRPAAEGSSATAHIVLEPIAGPHRLRVRGQDRRRRHPAGLPAGGRQGHPGGDGRRASSPARPCRASACCSSTARTTRSTRRRWRSRSPARWRSSRPTSRPTRCCSSRSWRSTSRFPTTRSASVNGDLNSRRGRLQGMEPIAGMTRIKAEVPMAEMLTYGQALTSMTGGRGDYHMQFLRYDEVPSHVAQKLIEDSKKEQEEAKV